MSKAMKLGTRVILADYLLKELKEVADESSEDVVERWEQIRARLQGEDDYPKQAMYYTLSLRAIGWWRERFCNKVYRQVRLDQSASTIADDDLEMEIEYSSAYEAVSANEDLTWIEIAAFMADLRRLCIEIMVEGGDIARIELVHDKGTQFLKSQKLTKTWNGVIKSAVKAINDTKLRGFSPEECTLVLLKIRQPESSPASKRTRSPQDYADDAPAPKKRVPSPTKVEGLKRKLSKDDSTSKEIKEEKMKKKKSKEKEKSKGLEPDTESGRTTSKEKKDRDLSSSMVKTKKEKEKSGEPKSVGKLSKGRKSSKERGDQDPSIKDPNSTDGRDENHPARDSSSSRVKSKVSKTKSREISSERSKSRGEGRSVERKKVEEAGSEKHSIQKDTPSKVKLKAAETKSIDSSSERSKSRRRGRPSERAKAGDTKSEKSSDKSKEGETKRSKESSLVRSRSQGKDSSSDRKSRKDERSLDRKGNTTMSSGTSDTYKIPKIPRTDDSAARSESGRLSSAPRSRSYGYYPSDNYADESYDASRYSRDPAGYHPYDRIPRGGHPPPRGEYSRSGRRYPGPPGRFVDSSERGRSTEGGRTDGRRSY